MTDTIIKGSGNSRSIITVPNALTLYPTHEELMQKWATEGIPIDLLGPNASGVDVLGTLLNKENLLTDATEQSIWGSAANRTVNAALSQLRSLITTAEGKVPTIQTGSIVIPGSSNSFSIYIDFKPKLFILKPRTYAPFSGGVNALFFVLIGVGSNVMLIASTTGSYTTFNNAGSLSSSMTLNISYTPTASATADYIAIK